MKKQLTEKIKNLQIEKLAKDTKFYVRKPRKILASNFVMSFFMMMMNGKFSLKSWAFHISTICGELVSHQSVAKKLGFGKIDFVNHLFEKALSSTLNQSSVLQVQPIIIKFERVFVEDSTCFKLPYNLFASFPGSRNQAKENATGKIQLCIDIKNNKYNHIKLMSFRDTDAKYTNNILNHLKKGDLVLRDLGYWNSKTFDSITNAEAFFISRLRSSISVHKPDNKELIDLVAYLKDKDKKGITKVEIPIVLNKSKETYRMVALKLNEAQVQKRRADSKKRRKHGRNKGRGDTVSDKTKYLMSWNIFITNIEENKLQAEQIYSVYSLRWNIETIFKHWKSNFKLGEFVKTCTGPNPARPEILIVLYLTWIVLIYNPAFNFYQNQVYKKTNKVLSPGKFADFIKTNFEFMCIESVEKITKILAYYSCFDNRKDRVNHFEKLNMIKLS